LMAQCSAQGSGAMLAVFAEVDAVVSLIDEHSLDVVIANKNAPRQCVLAGPDGEIERIHRVLVARGITTRPVPVSAAFHSRFVADASGPFRQVLDSVSLEAGTVPVFANATGELYPDDPDSVRELLAGQIARPVEFLAQVEAMYRMGARTFLE